jgi:hypothetical protein
MIQVYQHGGHTMGDSLIAVCMYNSLNEPVHITTGIDSWYIKWKNIFNIGDQVTLTPTAACPTWLNPPHPKFLESFKFFNRYDQFDQVTLFNHTFPIGRTDKKCVAIFINNGAFVKNDDFFNLVESNKNGEYPYSKFHTRSTYDFIIRLVQNAGYDPLIIDHKDISVEHKVFLLNELCDFAIGYEGGMMHLAHSLRIPTIMLPWRATGYDSDFMHLDKKTYFVRDVEEIFTWTAKQLVELVDGLRTESAYNNQWLVDPICPDPGNLLKRLEGSNDQFYAQLAWVTSHMDKITLGGF